MEIGPYRVQEDGTLRYNDGSWDEFANILFVDNPVGTGFSYVNTDSYVHELTDMADQMVTFLEKFFALFPEYQNNDVSCAKVVLESRADEGVALYGRGIIRRPTYSLHCKSHPRPERVSNTTEQVEPVGLVDRKWLDLACRTI